VEIIRRLQNDLLVKAWISNMPVLKRRPWRDGDDFCWSWSVLSMKGSKIAPSHWQNTSLIQQLAATTQAMMMPLTGGMS